MEKTLKGAIATTVSTPWGTFEKMRDHLFEQFVAIPFDTGTGVSLEELEEEIETFLKANPDLPRVLQKAEVFRIVLTRGRIAVDPHDWFVDKIDHRFMLNTMTPERERVHGGLVRKLSLQWLDEALEGPLDKDWNWLRRAYEIGQASGPVGGLDRGHLSPGWDKLLARGLNGLLSDVRNARESLGSKASAQQLAFYRAVEIVYTAAIDLAGRFSRLASAMAAEHSQQEQRLRTIASACSNVPANRPRTLHEALQFMWLMHELIEMEGEFVRSMGQFDRTLYPFYRADIDSGRLDREQAKELIKFFWFKWYSRTRGKSNGKNFCFGGQYPDGTEITNDLTYLALEAYEELNTPDPKLSVRFLPGSPEKLYKRVADLVRSGHNSIVLMNDPPAVEALVKRGKSREDARFYLPIGCYEPAVEGKEIGCTMNLTVNLAKGVELALNRGRDPLSSEQVGLDTGDPRQFDGFEDLWRAYTDQMEYFLTRSAECIRAAEKQWPMINPSPLVAATIEDCIARGLDIGQGGAHYNSVGFVGAGLANASDSLLAIKNAVFDERRFSMGDIIEALGRNFDGEERMRQYLLNRVPKWGNNDEDADAMAKRVADFYCSRVHTMENARGGSCQAALFTLVFSMKGGKLTGALPDGRRAHESLAPGMGASYGRDVSGLTALLESAAKIDATLTPNGAVLDVTLHPSAVGGEEGLEALVNLIKTYFSNGGYAIQFNVFDVDTLRDAQQHPEKYASLQIRVTGWSVYFTTLSEAEQNQFIARTTHSV